MPKKFEQSLRAGCVKKGLSGKDCDRYVYGTMTKAGWRSSKKKGKGKKKGKRK